MGQDLGQSTETLGLGTKSPSLLLASRMYVEVGQANREGTGLYSVLTSFWLASNMVVKASRTIMEPI